MKRLLTACAVIVCITQFSSCYYDNEQLLYGEQTCNNETVTFAANVSTIINRNCIQCHSASMNSGGVTLEGYENVRVHAESGRLIGAVTHAGGFSPMPKNAPKLSDCDIDAIQKWVNEGALNN